MTMYNKIESKMKIKLVWRHVFCVMKTTRRYEENSLVICCPHGTCASVGDAILVARRCSGQWESPLTGISAGSN